MKMLPILLPLPLSLALAASAALAEPPAAAGATTPRPDQNQIVCRSVRETGSRLAHNRICMTRQEWEEQYRTNRQLIEHQQASAIRPGSPG